MYVSIMAWTSGHVLRAFPGAKLRLLGFCALFKVAPLGSDSGPAGKTRICNDFAATSFLGLRQWRGRDCHDCSWIATPFARRCSNCLINVLIIN